MQLIVFALIVGLTASLILNIFAYLQGKKTPEPKPRLDVSALDLLHDLTVRGQAIVRIETIDSEALLLRRPGS
tara:strand:- start:1353 stop:1571 length:219 start_codon:yes stop_codon:yes gene_type:complete